MHSSRVRTPQCAHERKIRFLQFPKRRKKATIPEVLPSGSLWQPHQHRHCSFLCALPTQASPYKKIGEGTSARANSNTELVSLRVGHHFPGETFNLLVGKETPTTFLNLALCRSQVFHMEVKMDLVTASGVGPGTFWKARATPPSCCASSQIKNPPGTCYAIPTPSISAQNPNNFQGFRSSLQQSSTTRLSLTSHTPSLHCAQHALRPGMLLTHIFDSKALRSFPKNRSSTRCNIAFAMRYYGLPYVTIYSKHAKISTEPHKSPNTTKESKKCATLQKTTS